MKIFKWCIPFIILCVYNSCKEKEFDVFGQICNQRSDTVKIIMSPYQQFQQTQNGDLHLKSHNSTLDTALYSLNPNICCNVARGVNDIHETDLTFSYLEIRTANDTIIGKGKTEIVSMFKDVRKGLKSIDVH